MLKPISTAQIPLRGRICLLNLGCTVPTILVLIASGVQHPGQVVLAALLFAALSSLVLSCALNDQEQSREAVISLALRVARGDLAPAAGPAGRCQHDRLNEALDVMGRTLCERTSRVKAGGDELIQSCHTVLHMAEKSDAAVKEQSARGAETFDGVRQISRGLDEIAQAVTLLTEAADESSTSILEMARSIDGIAESADQLVQVELRMHAIVDEMVDNIGQAKESVVELAESAIETSSRVFDMDASIARVESNARDTAAISQKVLKDARDGKLAVESTLEGMQEIDRHSASASQAIGGLSKKVEDVGLILNVIRDIAEQTALLSLNSAIIAAQAGVHGKGFAVVSQEIKSLATRTRDSITEIATVIEAVQHDTQQAVRAISTAVASVKSGEALALRSNDALEKIVLGVCQAAEQVDGIVGAAKEQAASSQVIRGATEQMSRTICEISGVLCFLGGENDQILGATAQIGAQVGRLQTATREQSRASTHIVRATEKVSQQLVGIEAACSDRQLQVARILLSEDRPRSSSQLQEVEPLARRIRAFESELSLLRTGGSPEMAAIPDQATDGGHGQQSLKRK